MSEEIILKDLTSITPFKGGPANEWFVTSKNHKPIALFTETDEPWLEYPIVEIRARKTKREINGKTFVVYDAVDIIYDYYDGVEEILEEDSIDLNSLSIDELKAYIESKAPKDGSAKGVAKWAKLMGYMSLNLLNERNELKNDEEYKVNKTIDHTFDSEYGKALSEGFGDLGANELPLMRAADLNVNSPSLSKSYVNGSLGDLRAGRNGVDHVEVVFGLPDRY